MTQPLPFAPAQVVAPTLHLFIPGEPQSKGRPRAVVTGKGKIAMYTPRNTAQYEASIATYAMRAMAVSRWPRPTPEDRFALRIELFFATARRRDVDNVCKSLMDGMQGPVFEDDWQVVSLAVRRFLKSPRPGARIYVTRAEEAFDAQ